MPQCCTSDDCIWFLPNIKCVNGMCQNPLSTPPFAACDPTACNNYCQSCQSLSSGGCALFINECQCN